MALILYVDDMLICRPIEKEIEQVFTDLEEAGYKLTREDSGADAFHFLGIELNMESKNTIKFTQHGLIKKLLETVGMMECNPCKTPANITPVSTDAEGKPFQETWKYSSAVGMMMYLASNAYPEIQVAVCQCA